MQTETTDHHTILEAIARWVKNYRTTLGASRELAQCDPQDVAAIAQDLMISPAELRTLADKSPDSARLLYRMLNALGVDASALSEHDPLVIRDLERLCVSCTHKRKCAHELATGGASDHYDEFCPNAYTLDMLVAARKQAPATRG
ncbi:MAG: DUF6455 family protein [Pseudolabrys sp.]